MPEREYILAAAPVTCPPSAVHDQILTWDKVGGGDLVLWDGEFRLVEWNGIYRDSGMRLVKLDGDDMPGTIPCGTYAAVRRYDVEG